MLVKRIEAHKFYDTKKYKMMCNVNPSVNGSCSILNDAPFTPCCVGNTTFNMSFELVSIVEWRTANSMNCKSKGSHRIGVYSGSNQRMCATGTFIVTQFQGFLFSDSPTQNHYPFCTQNTQCSALYTAWCAHTHTYTSKSNGKLDFLQTFTKVSAQCFPQRIFSILLPTANDFNRYYDNNNVSRMICLHCVTIK